METRILPVKLSDEEVAVRASRLADTVRDRDDKQAAIDEAKEEMKAEIKGLEADLTEIESRVSKLAEVVRTRHERQEVEVDWVPNYEDNKMQLVRRDSGEVVEERPMTAEERQKSLFQRSN